MPVSSWLEFLVERYWPSLGKIDELIKNNQIASPYFFFQASAGRGSENMSTADFLQCVDIGAKINLHGGDGVISSMSGDESDVNPLNLSDA